MTASEEPSKGSTRIAPQVVQKIAGLTAREVPGIHSMGNGASRAMGAVRERIPGSGTSQTSGVQVEVGEKQAAVDLALVIEYGMSMVELTRSVRGNVIEAVQQLTGLEVIEVNIAVNDVHVATSGDEPTTSAPARVE